MQLPASRDLYNQLIHRAGYAHVGEIGPDVDQQTFVDNELVAMKQGIEGLLSQITDLPYEEFVGDTHCRWCSHNSLSCATTLAEIEDIE